MTKRHTVTAAALAMLALPAFAADPVPAVPGAMPLDPAAPPNVAPGILPQDLSVWGMFTTADFIVQAVMVGLFIASVTTWTVWLSKNLELHRARKRARGPGRGEPVAHARRGGPARGRP